MELLYILWEIMTGLSGVEADYAALASIVVPLLGSAAIGGLQHILSGPDRRRARRRASRAESRADESLVAFQDLLEGYEDRVESADSEAERGFEDLYGSQVQQITDRVGADQSSAASNIFRTLMAGGGDITGSGSSLLRDLQQSGQRTISDAIREYTERADRRSLQQRARGDQIFADLTRQTGGLFSDLTGIGMQERGRSDRMTTANRQFWLDILGTGSSLAGQLQ